MPRAATPEAFLPRLFLLILTLSLGALHGCATVPVNRGVPAEVVRNEQLARLRDLEAWALQGRVAVSARGDSFGGSLFWTQEADDLEMQFRAPLGLGGFRIVGDDELLEVEMSSGESFLVEDPEPELEREFGWSLPVHSLRYWMLGMPDPRGEWNETLAVDGTPSRIDQRGWTVEYRRFEPVEGSFLPTHIELSGRGVRLRLAIDRWDLAPAPATTAAAGAAPGAGALSRAAVGL